ncbi:MAG: phytoene desaturase family protein [Verrucomicrobiota bacterium]|nr:phytoene desaturase family protein [Limisphaera sp.]MDW8380607.1 phytoene desaturase family protein [Verrucomicrobiota bacterium]
MKQSKVLVIGAGLGGVSAAISLRQRGYAVEVYEKNSHLGGKLNVLHLDGYTFDLGPSILTLPHYLRRLFERSGRRMEEYLHLQPVRPHWRNFFEDGAVVDLWPEPERMAAEALKVGEPPENVQRFLRYSGALYDHIERGYFEEGLDSWRDFAKFYGLFQFRRFDILRSMHQGVAAYFRTQYFRDIFDFFIKYVGSSAYRAPGFMNCLPTIQFRYDLWYVRGGMYGIATALRRLMEELDIPLHLGCEVVRLRHDGSRVSGIVTRAGRFHEADAVVCNMEYLPAREKLLGESPSALAALERKYEPSCSGLVIELGLDCQYPHLAHHNFFFSRDLKEHFADVFERYQLPEDPTVYVVAATRSDSSLAPSGCDTLKILPHIPYRRTDRCWTHADYLGLKQRIYAKLERMGLRDLQRHIVREHVWTPRDIEELYFSHRGSIYGVVSDRWRNFGFKAPKQSRQFANLFFVGGSVNPGAGMPMVILCGQTVARMIERWERG